MILGLLSEISVFFSSMEEPYLLKLLFYWISFFVLWCFPWQLSMAATDVIRQGQRISVSDTIVSAKGNFELGFFNPGNSHNYYVGIWYKNVAEKTIVWIANRDFPITTASEVLTIHSNGNFVISNQTQVTFTITNTTSKVNTSVILLDSGNLILRDQNSDVLWQSFDFPTHVFLPGMKLGIYNRGRSSWSFVSWKNSEDPGTGEFSLEIDADQPSQILIVKGSQRYWASGFWNGKIFNSIPEMRQNYIYNYIHVSNMDEIYFTYSLFNPSIISHHVMDISGQFKQRVWLHGSQVWKSFWAQPKAQCDVYAICGAFSLCNNRLSKFCQCLRGFEPRSPQDWLRGDKSSGCLRIVKLSCENAAGVNGGDDKFLKVPVSKFPSNGRIFVVSNVEECNLACLSNCSCSAFAYNGSRGCSVWSGDLFSLQQDELMNGETIYLKLSASELPNSGKRRPLLKIIPLVAALALLGFISYITWHWRHKFKRKGKSGSGQDILLFDLGVSAATTKNLSLNKKEVEFGERNNPAMTLFNFASISAATDNFSATNKLGEGGFGPVYEGTILRGQKIAVKRLSKRSAQGLEELKNEAMLIAKLQHRNLVKLLGCCLENEEKILVYEYMPNKSLDSFLFDPAKRSQLDWKTRVRIIEGIAQGLLYLHEYSRLRIIHRDLKASNILLDIDMNPKISDFGMARIFGSNELQANTNRIVGTYGYMPPEYALEGLFSVKSDVYSFGVLLLEILSGKKNTGFYNSDSLNLIGYAWDLWMRNKTLDLMDLELYDESSKHMGLRYVNVALLCVQEIAADRPTMVEVVSMLTNEVVVLSSPKEPAFSIVRSVTTTTNIPEICSVNDVTVSGLEAR